MPFPLPANAYFQQLGDSVGGDGLGEVESLGELAAHVAQKAQLVLGLDAFGDGDEPETPYEGDNRFHELERPIARVEMTDECAVDLDAVDRETIEVA